MIIQCHLIESQDLISIILFFYNFNSFGLYKTSQLYYTTMSEPQQTLIAQDQFNAFSDDEKLTYLRNQFGNNKFQSLPNARSFSNSLASIDSLYDPEHWKYCAERVASVQQLGKVEIEFWEAKYIEMFLTLRDWTDLKAISLAIELEFIW